MIHRSFKKVQSDKQKKLNSLSLQLNTRNSNQYFPIRSQKKLQIQAQGFNQQSPYGINLGSPFKHNKLKFDRANYQKSINLLKIPNIAKIKLKKSMQKSMQKSIQKSKKYNIRSFTKSNQKINEFSLIINQSKQNINQIKSTKTQIKQIQSQIKQKQNLIKLTKNLIMQTQNLTKETKISLQDTRLVKTIDEQIFFKDILQKIAQKRKNQSYFDNKFNNFVSNKKYFNSHETRQDKKPKKTKFSIQSFRLYDNSKFKSTIQDLFDFKPSSTSQFRGFIHIGKQVCLSKKLEKYSLIRSKTQQATNDTDKNDKIEQKTDLKNIQTKELNPSDNCKNVLKKSQLKLGERRSCYMNKHKIQKKCSQVNNQDEQFSPWQFSEHQNISKYQE